MVRIIVTSPESFSDEARRATIKTPLELVVSAMQPPGAEAGSLSFLPLAVGRLGAPLFKVEPPTGYLDPADAWVNSGALLNQMHFAMLVRSGPGRGGMAYGQWPRLQPERLFAGQDLALTADFCDVFAEALSRDLGLRDLTPVFSHFPASASRF